MTGPWRTTIAALGLAAALLGGPALAQETQPVPWRLDLEVTYFGFVSLSPRTGEAQTVWYALYRVTNSTGEDRPLQVHFRLDTDSEKTYFEVVNPAAELWLEHRYERKFMSASERPSTIADGETLEGVAFFGALDPNFDRIRMTVTGIEDPVFRVGTKAYYERRGQVYEWSRPGDEYFVRRDPLKFEKKYWKTLEGPKPIR